MNILVLASRPPWPPVRADQLTIDRMLRFLTQRGHTVDLVCFVTGAEADRALREGLSGACRRIDTVNLSVWRSYLSTMVSLGSSAPMQVAYFRSDAMSHLVEERVEAGGYDLLFVHLIRMAEYGRALQGPKVLGMQISQALNLQRMARHALGRLRRRFYRFELAKVRTYEARVCADFDRVLLSGDRDIEEVAKSTELTNAVACPHGQDIPTQETLGAFARVPGAIVISGVMGTDTNVAAVHWFARDIFPHVLQEVPHASLWIVGRQPRRGLRALARPPRIIVTGEVADVQTWLCRAEVAVAPMRIGAGMQNKVIEAMACGLPVVATGVANEGVGAEPARQVIIRDDESSFAQAVIDLLRDSAERARLGREGRAFVEKSWSWEVQFERMLQVFREAARERSDGERALG